MNTTRELSEGERLGSRERYIAYGIQIAFEKVKKRFEDSPNLLDRLPFHRVLHSSRVSSGVVQVLRAVQRADPLLVSDRDVQNGEHFGANHDVVQGWEKEEKFEAGYTIVRRKRFVGKNEIESAQELFQYMDWANDREQQEIFTREDYVDGVLAHQATIPDYNFDFGTVVQPYLTHSSSLTTHAVAMVDIGAAGMSSSAFLKDGDNLFQEEQLDILEALYTGRHISREEASFFKRRMLSWTESQLKFVRGREAMFQQEMEGIPVKARDNVANLFCEFDLSYNGVLRVLNRRNIMGFREIAHDMGYQLQAI